MNVLKEVVKIRDDLHLMSLQQTQVSGSIDGARLQYQII